MPVLPLVESRMVRVLSSLPVRSPSRIMLIAGRSLTEPPGLKYSALQYISMPERSAGILSRRMSGVPPMCDKMEADCPGSVESFSILLNEKGFHILASARRVSENGIGFAFHNRFLAIEAPTWFHKSAAYSIITRRLLRTNGRWLKRVQDQSKYIRHSGE